MARRKHGGRRGDPKKRASLQSQIAQIALTIAEHYPGLIKGTVNDGLTIGDLASALITQLAASEVEETIPRSRIA